MGTLAAIQKTPLTEMNEFYRRDGFTWATRQADALRRRDFAAVDWGNVIEEIKDVGRREQSRWQAHCARVIEHLLKIEHYREATEKTLKHWSREVTDFRIEMARTIRNNPGLKGQYEIMLADAWQDGRAYARRRLAEYDESNDALTGLKKALRDRDRTLPVECPYRLEDVTAFAPQTDREPRDDVWPPSVARILNTRLGYDDPVRH